MLLVKAGENSLINELMSLVKLVREWDEQKKIESPPGIESLTFRTPVEHSNHRLSYWETQGQHSQI